MNTNFGVSNRGSIHPYFPPPPPLDTIQQPYQWGSFDIFGNHMPHSVNGFIGILLPNTAIIRVPSAGWDALKVRLDTNYYSPHYNAIFEKVVPIYVGP